MDTNINTTPKKHGIRYPWEEWFKQGNFTLTKGVHFHHQPHGMAMTARQAARKYGYNISIDIEPTTLTVRVTKKRGT